MAVSGRIGVSCKLYYNTGTYAAPVWTAITKVGDLSVKAEWGKMSADSRESTTNLWLKGLLDLEVTFKVRKDYLDTAALAVDDAAASPTTVIDFLLLDGGSTTTGSRGYRFESQVFSLSESQNPSDVLYPEYKIAPAPTSNGPPARAVVTAGSPVFTSLAP